MPTVPTSHPKEPRLRLRTAAAPDPLPHHPSIGPGSGGSGNPGARAITRPGAGASFDELVRHVSRSLRMTEANAAKRVSQVLELGVQLKQIARTSDGGYALLRPRPPGLAYRIREVRFSDDSSASD